MDKDVEILRRMLSQPGRWLVHVHSGHIVKVARVAPEIRRTRFSTIRLLGLIQSRLHVMLRRARAEAYRSSFPWWPLPWLSQTEDPRPFPRGLRCFSIFSHPSTLDACYVASWQLPLD